MDNRKDELTVLIKKILLRILKAQFVNLFGIKVSGQARRYMIDVFVDRPTGGITIGQCTQITRLLTKTIEAESADRRRFYDNGVFPRHRLAAGHGKRFCPGSQSRPQDFSL